MPWYDDPKHPLRSKTIWAGMAQIIVALAVAVFGVAIDTATTTEVLFAAFNLVSGVVTIYGRATAVRPVG